MQTTNNSSMNLLQDKKEMLGTLPCISKHTDSISRLMHFFKTPCSCFGDLPKHLESWQHNKADYQDLGWTCENLGLEPGTLKFDVINSFWTVFVCALVDYSNKIEKNHGNPQYWNSQGKEWSCKIFEFGINTSLSYATKYGLLDIGKENYADKAVDPKNIQSKVISKFFLDTEDTYGKQLKKLAALTHSVANFMPCPSLLFNSEKGAKVDDFLPLMIDLIDKACTTECTDTVENNKWKQWKTWFIINRTKCCLEDYYDVYTENGIQHIKGKPFFGGQSLENPRPKKAGEIIECLDTMINRIERRATKLSAQINQYYSCPICGEVKLVGDYSIPSVCEDCAAAGKEP